MELVIEQYTVNKYISFDWELALEQTGHKEKITKEILSLFLQELPKLQKTMLDALSNNDITLLADTLHKLSGSCSYCGMPRLRQLIKEFESGIKNNKFPSHQQSIDEINKEINFIKEAITKQKILP